MSTSYDFPITLRSAKTRGNVVVELNALRFERLAANLGLFSQEFLASVEQAEKEIHKGQAKILRSLSDLRAA